MGAVLEQLELQIHDAIDKENIEGLRNLLPDQHPADIADVLERLDIEERYAIFRLLEPELAAEVLNEMGGSATRELLMEMPVEDAGEILDEMTPDDAVEILTEDVPELQEELLAAMEPEYADELERLLEYPPQSAGLLMTDMFVRIKKDMTAADAIIQVRSADDDIETITDLYVLADDRTLLGVLSLRELITAPPESRIEDIMNDQVIAVPPEMDQEMVARLVSRYDFLAIPVVDAQGKILGIITVDDIVDVLIEESNEDMLRFAGVEPGVGDEPYFAARIPRVIRRRAGWLLLLFVAETFTGNVLRIFEDELAQVVALSFYIPLLIGTGGNTGAQTVSTIIRGISLGEIRLRDTWRVVWRELGSGLLLGSILGIFGFFRALLWGNSWEFSLVVGLSVMSICTWANSIGSLIPLVAHRFKIDPAIVSAPLITTLVDATGLFIYLTIARLILGL